MSQKWIYSSREFWTLLQVPKSSWWHECMHICAWSDMSIRSPSGWLYFHLFQKIKMQMCMRGTYKYMHILIHMSSTQYLYMCSVICYLFSKLTICLQHQERERELQIWLEVLHYIKIVHFVVGFRIVFILNAALGEAQSF
jgi:hypothetical protein